MSDCVINPYSSSVCVLGTKSCVMKHTGIVERDKLIAELEEEIEHLWDLVNAPIDLQEENERLNDALLEMRMTADAESKDAERYRWEHKHRVRIETAPGRWETMNDEAIDAEIKHPTTWPMIERQGARIKELEAERDQLGEWMERGNIHVGELVAENERLRTEADMYLAALKDIRSSASEYGFVLARVARQAIDAARRESDETL